MARTNENGLTVKDWFAAAGMTFGKYNKTELPIVFTALKAWERGEDSCDCKHVAKRKEQQ